MKSLLVLSLLAVTVLAACSPNTATTQESTPEVVENTVTAPEADLSASPMAESDATSEEVRIVEVEAGSFYFNPNEIRVKKGEKVRIVMNSVSMMHDFVIDELGVKLPVTQSGETGTVEFVADTAGSFEYYCSVGNHRAQGQVGTLIVEE
jgi:nitrosocyanin